MQVKVFSRRVNETRKLEEEVNQWLDSMGSAICVEEKQVVSAGAATNMTSHIFVTVFIWYIGTDKTGD